MANARPGGGVRFEFRIEPQIRQGRDLAGLFDKFQTEGRRANQRLAQDLAEAAARNQQRSRVRPRVSEGHLNRAIRNSWFANFDLLLVGIEKELDASEARYWRQIEGLQGQAVWDTLVGRRMVGFWTGAPGVRGFEDAPWPGGLGQRFVHARSTRAREVLLGRGRRRASSGGSDQPFGTIRHGIRAQRFYERAFKQFLDQRTHERLYEQLFARAGQPIRFRRVG